MKNIKNTFYALLAIISFSSCSSDDNSIPDEQSSLKKEKIYRIEVTNSTSNPEDFSKRNSLFVVSNNNIDIKNIEWDKKDTENNEQGTIFSFHKEDDELKEKEIYITSDKVKYGNYSFTVNRKEMSNSTLIVTVKIFADNKLVDEKTHSVKENEIGIIGTNEFGFK